MSAKRVILIALIASTVLLGVGIGPGAQVLPLAQEPDPAGVTVPYPGRLDDRAGQPVVDGAYDFAFALYDGPAGGEPLWSEVQSEVMVEGGSFMALLGSANRLPQEVLDGRERWLEVSVRGPGEAAFTALAPRQRVGAAAPAAPSSPAAAPACPHDHFGEQWIGTGSDGLSVSTDNWTALYGSSASDIAIMGVSSPYVSIWLLDRQFGVFGYSYSDHGVYGLTDGNYGWRSGVYGEARQNAANGVTGWNSAGGPGVYGYSETGYAGYYNGPVLIRGRSTSSANEALRVEDPAQLMGLSVRDDGSVAIGRLSGSAAAHICSRIESADARNVFALCSSAAEYVPTVDNGLGFPEAGDLVSIVPEVSDPYGDEHAPFAVAKATSPYDPNLVGFISDPELGADGRKLNDHYLPMAIYGYFPVKVTMHNGSIRRGDPITSSPKPGYGMKATMPGRIVGYALEDADKEGVIWIVVQVGDHLGDAPERIDELEAEVLAWKQAHQRMLEQVADLVARISALETLVAGAAGKEGGQ